MKEKLKNAASRYAVINLAFLPLLPVLRTFEYFLLRGTPEFPGKAFPVESIGLLYDLFAFSVFVFIMFIPFFFLYILNRKIGEYFYIALLCLLTVVQICIIKYFSISLTPLDEAIFSFSFKEIMLIIGSSDDLNFMSFFPMVVSVLLLLILQFLARKILPGRVMIFVVAGFGILILLSGLILTSGDLKDEQDFTHSLKINKCGYFVKSSIGALFRGSYMERSEEVIRKIEKYQSIHSEFNFINNDYPLFHSENTQDALGPFFRLSPQPPNLVFIIVESLSSACFGDSSWYGNFTPFLDSLSKHSLYWDNFLSTSERTFHVLQALFGSLPYGKGEFQKDKAVMPYHNSLIRILRENGYYSSFYYAGDATFTNYDQFLEKQGLDFMLRYFGPKYDKMLLEDKSFKWGYQDGALFERSIDMLDSLKKEPRLDIYLTLSMHYPFHPPRAAMYLDQVQKILDSPGFPMYQRIRSARFKELFSSVLYTDDAIRSFVKAYSKRGDFNNTIFFITGDHSFTEFGNSNISAIEHYHVPMIIFSPLLKEPRHFLSVSSHLDITPSLLAMLGPVYNFKTDEKSHWLGQGIDTASMFRNIHTMAFTRKSNKTVEYLKNDYYYSGELLYKIGEGLKTNPVNDNPKRQEMKDELKTTVTVYNYTNQNNLLMPSRFRTAVRQEQVALRSYDGGILKTASPEQSYLNLMSPAEIRSKYMNMVLDIRFRYMISEAADTNKFPELAASVENKNFKKALYHLIKFSGTSSGNVKPDIWYSVHLNESMDVSMIDSLNGHFLKLYFYYHKPCGIQFDSLQIIVKGTK